MAGSPTEVTREASQSGRKRRLWIVRTSFTVLLVFTLVAGVRAITLKDISIHLGNGQNITVTTAALRVGTALSRAGVQLFDGDVVIPGLEAPLRRGDVISVRRAFPVEITVDGKLLQIRTVSDTVAQILKLSGVQLGKDDKVKPSLSTKLQKDTVISVIRVSHGYSTTTEPVPFKTVRRHDPTMDQGKTRVSRQGVNGTLQRTYKLTYENGKLKGKVEVKREIVKTPVDAVVQIGTRIVPKVVHSNSGKYLQYSSVKTMLATAYLPGDGVTSTGVRAKKGVVAVDPRVIPLGSRVYIPGYGEAIAADTGGAIKGLRIDLCYATRREAIQFGRRPVKVYILARR